MPDELDPTGHSALPRGWHEAIGTPNPFIAGELSPLLERVADLARGIPLLDRAEDYQGLVGSPELRTAPIHRWYYYKEAFSPSLPAQLLDDLQLGSGLRVLDPFAGVGTTALGLRSDPRVSEVVGVEYSPFAAFVGRTKLAAKDLDPARLREHLARIQDFSVDRRINVPGLSSFSNPEIFSYQDLATLLAARDRVRLDRTVTEPERDFFLLGIAAVLEDVSGAMKDGRALRILRGRRRRPNALTPSAPIARDGPRSVIINQWASMIEDLESDESRDYSASCRHLRGDARHLRGVLEAYEIDSREFDACIYSPPYLNCLDYTEVYKLELWFLELVASQDEFRSLRQGTLRSHPSIVFPQRPDPFPNGDAQSDEVFELVNSLSTFLASHLPRAPVGHTVGQYFRDMYETLREQYSMLGSDGIAICVVANSSFAARSKVAGEVTEHWRLPILTDVLLARLAEAAGFERTEIWEARSLRPRNITAGQARESIVIARKAGV